MIETEPRVKPTAKLSSKQTAAVLEIHPNTLRKYSDLGLIKFFISQANGRKYFTGTEILKFWNTKF